MHWLAQQLGLERMLRTAVLVPTDECFPDDFDGSAHDAERLKALLCNHMQINPQDVPLRIVEDEQMPRAVGHYDQEHDPVIRIARSQLGDTEGLIATLAHELAHEVLLGRKLLTGEEPDHEWVTDLLPAFLGLGIFAANAIVIEQPRHAPAYQKEVWRVGYLPIRMHGYALALFAWVRNEPDPAWANHLRPDAATSMKHGLRYLRKTGDSLFDTRRAQSSSKPATHQLVEQLGHPSASFRLSALWELATQGEAAAKASDVVAACLGDRDPHIREQAARTLVAFGQPAKSAVPALAAKLRDSHDGVRAAAALAVGVLADPTEDLLESTVDLLQDPCPQVIYAAALAMQDFGEAAQVAIPSILAAFRSALVDCNYAMSDVLAGALAASTNDPQSYVRDYFESDPDLARQAFSALESTAENTVK